MCGFSFYTTACEYFHTFNLTHFINIYDNILFTLIPLFLHIHETLNQGGYKKNLGLVLLKKHYPRMHRITVFLKLKWVRHFVSINNVGKGYFWLMRVR